MNPLTIRPIEANNALSVIREKLTKSLVAVYLHGSAATGNLRHASDIDLLAITSAPLAQNVSADLIRELMKISDHPDSGDSTRPIELIIFQDNLLAKAVYPARCEFIYGEWLRHEFEAGHNPGPVSDPELTLVLAQARREAIPLYGPEACKLLPPIPPSDIRRAIRDHLPHLMKTLPGDERNTLLTLARMWKTLVSGEFVAKDIAAAWAAARLPDRQAAVLADAGEDYLNPHRNKQKHDRQAVRETAEHLHHHIMASLEFHPPYS